MVPVVQMIPTSTSGGTTVQSNNGAVTLYIPPGIAQENGTPIAVQLEVRPVETSRQAAIAIAAPELKTIQIEMRTPDGRPITQLSRPMYVEINFDQAEVEAAGVDPLTLRIRYSNDGITWTDAPTVIKDGKAQILVNHLTLFQLAGAKHRVIVPMVNAKRPG